MGIISLSKDKKIQNAHVTMLKESLIIVTYDNVKTKFKYCCM